jgi:hypothetical protein
MSEFFKYFFCLLWALLLNTSDGSAQTKPAKIIRTEGTNLILNNGDTLPLVSLSNQKYQLILFAFHSEEDTIGLDPGLSVDGRWRAIHLSNLFKQIDFKGYYTTPFRNNILTLQPLVDFKKTKVSYYDQADLQSLTKSIKSVFPSPVIVVVHPETVGLIFEQLTQQKYPYTLQGNLSEKLIVIQRANKGSSKWNEFVYSIR